jgi:hypothetical protein
MAENTDPPRAPGELERVAYDVAVRAPAQQEAALNELRGRAGTLLAASSIVASFIGGQALQRVGLDGWTVAALFTLAMSLVACIVVLWPRDGLIFALSGPEVYEVLYAESMAETHRRLAYWVQWFRDDNQITIRLLSDAYRLGAAGTIGQVMLWGAALAIR